jgi:CHAD domain-containing protein
LARQFREFELDTAADPDGPAWRGPAEALRARFRVTADGSRAVRRVWLDTFDQRLRRAGVTLEYLSGAGGHELALSKPTGDRIAAATVRMSWPALASDLPPGPIADDIRRIAGIRALLPVVSARSTQHGLRVLDSEDKTVARVTVDDTSLRGPAAGAPPARLRIVAVRGYEAQAGRVERLLSGCAGITPAVRSAFETALAASGRDAAPGRGEAAVVLTAAMPSGAAIGSLLLRLLDTAQANVGGVVRDIDTEFLHDLRIAVRRTRSALKLLGDALPGDLAARYAPEFRWLGQVTTPVRDLDVHLLGFESAAAGLVTAAPGDLAPLHESLIRYRAAEQRRLVRALRSPRFAALTEGWRAALSEVAPPDAGSAGSRDAGTAPGARPRSRRDAPRAGPAGGGRTAHPGIPIGNLAAARLKRAYRRLARSGAAITATSPEADLHLVRKRGKELRYLLEFFASLHEPAVHRSAVRELKQLQDCLGAIQDGHVQREMIRALAARMVAEQAAPAATLLAMGELAAQIDAAASRAREEFGWRFAEFTSRGNVRNIAALTKVGAA